ncbi:DUF2256 domain-containing protein [Rhodocytophaga rosea]|uniref:DUF2256 domain-containing protein n=1 Tax=Rhodocytophaga rosea TaxID=2704465 RepID=A0A6C0GRE4_9BACT|nr:DUF2256 domain-containing protein [Rhodocytophaga rosea]QHT70122.1 DUF2256 domain-containing protein [Rhodocytophaga rosea]
MHKKAYLPEKICEVCNRPFTWRKKWKNCWEAVKYCSDKCRSLKTMPAESRTDKKPA